MKCIFFALLISFSSSALASLITFSEDTGLLSSNGNVVPNSPNLAGYQLLLGNDNFLFGTYRNRTHWWGTNVSRMYFLVADGEVFRFNLDELSNYTPAGSLPKLYLAAGTYLRNGSDSSWQVMGGPSTYFTDNFEIDISADRSRVTLIGEGLHVDFSSQNGGRNLNLTGSYSVLPGENLSGLFSPSGYPTPVESPLHSYYNPIIDDINFDTNAARVGDSLTLYANNNLLWDLDNDGEFDDATGNQVNFIPGDSNSTISVLADNGYGFTSTRSFQIQAAPEINVNEPQDDPMAIPEPRLTFLWFTLITFILCRKQRVVARSNRLQTFM